MNKNTDGPKPNGRSPVSAQAVKKVVELLKDNFIPEIPRRFAIGQAILGAVKKGCKKEKIYEMVCRQTGTRSALLANCVLMAACWTESELRYAMLATLRFGFNLNFGHVLALGQIEDPKIRRKFLWAVICDEVSCWELSEWVQDYQNGFREIDDDLVVFESGRDEQSREAEMLEWNDD